MGAEAYSRGMLWQERFVGSLFMIELALRFAKDCGTETWFDTPRDGDGCRKRPRSKCAPIKFGAKRKIFSVGSEAPAASTCVCASPLPFVRTFCSVMDSGAALVGVFSVAAAAAACRLVLLSDMTAVVCARVEAVLLAC